jgi:single-strand DNA-binding protein
VLMDQSSQDDTLVGVGPPGRPAGTPSHVSPQGTSFASVPRGQPHDSGGRAISSPGNLTDNLELRHTEAGIARAMFRVAVSSRREQEASFFTVIVWRDQAEHAAQSLAKGSRVLVVGRLQQRAWTAEDGSTRSVVEVVAEELGPSLRVGNGDHDQDNAERELGDCLSVSDSSLIR